jgi:hypothetical protein
MIPVMTHVTNLTPGSECTPTPWRALTPTRRRRARGRWEVWVVTPGGRHSMGYMEHTGCHQLSVSTMRPTRVVTPGCEICYMDWLATD